MTVSSLYQINPNHKLSTAEILKIIYGIDAGFFDDDKILISIFDEIAMLNGYSFESLPQRWTIIRQKYKLQSENKNNKNDIIENSSQLSFDF